MPVNIAQCRAGTGRFHSRIIIQKTKNKFSDPFIIFKYMLLFFYNVFISIFILKAGDIELNPGPKKIPHSYFSCCHCNVNNLATDNYSKVLALKAYNSTYKYDFICISETFLDSSFEPDDKDLMLDGYKLIRSDHPSNTKRGGVCIYYKESLAVRLVGIISLPECLVCEVTVQNIKGYIVVMYRSPSQSSIEFESFLSGFEDMFGSVIFSKSQFTVILGNFNARSSSWWSNDITNINGTLIDSLTATHGFKQLISDPTHMLPQSTSCIDLILTDQPNYIIDCGTHPSLNKNCHHQITFCKLNLKAEYRPPYQPLVWNFKKSNNDAIKKAIELVNWNSLFSH